ncbi:hypothetical protein CABS01_06027 [Colletotrichum abscissum]|uniref:Uncharacterized protein n=1 Tax=Colletotrichum abscissum TaxID=1671311 RepID=A0A9Q0AXY7_9PEZI|nr:uncharacterized protein CABS01_06027 [Colletotrichum abscissum]KAI3536885.1 hypothetical protein CABS02_12326 [Colletotrichum abscissum]KAK1518493.1 hypothetical protein CABS01_06027 [Colletotrichum abscissum]
MNWTEGALARHSRGKGWKPEIAKQKQYFAKARSGLHGPPKPGFDSISFFSQQANSSTYPMKRLSTVPSQNSPHFQQHQQHRHSQHRQYDQKNQHNVPQDHRLLMSPGQHVRKEPLVAGGHGILQEPRSQHATKKRKLPEYDPELLDAKRHRLLQKGDWAGINVQKSLPLHFSGASSSKGRQIWGFRNKHPEGQSGFFWEQNGNGRRPLQGKATSYISTQGGDKDVRIRIGSEDIRYSGGSQITAKSSQNRLPRTATQSKSLRQSEYFVQTSSQFSAQDYGPPGLRGQRALPVSETISSTQRKHGQSAACRGNPPRASMSLKAYRYPTRLERLPKEPSRLERLQKEGRSLLVESSPSRVHHPVPRRLSQLVMLERSGKPASEMFGSTIGQVGRNPMQEVAPSECSENQRWQKMIESHEDQTKSPFEKDSSASRKIVKISPGVSNILISSSSVVHDSRFDHPPMSTFTDFSLDDRAQDSMETGQYKRFGTSIKNDGQPRATAEKMRSSSPLLPIISSTLSAGRPRGDLYNDKEGLSEDTSLAHAESCSDDGHYAQPRQLPPMFESDSEDKPTLNKQEPSEQNLRPTDEENEEVETSIFLPQTLDTDAGNAISVPGSDKVDMDTEWMSFIFGEDVEKDEDIAFKESLKEAARDLRPSSSSAGDYYQPSVVPISAFASKELAPHKMLQHQHKGALNPASLGSSLKAGQTDMAIRGDLVDCELEHSQYQTTDTNIAGSFIAEDSDSIIPQSGTESLTSEVALTQITDSMSMIAQPSNSDLSENVGQRFAKPKTFVGRLACSSSRDPRPVLPLSVNEVSKKRGRPKGRSRKKKAEDGRANIRGLPDYDGDPIEGGSDE